MNQEPYINQSRFRIKPWHIVTLVLTVIVGFALYFVSSRSFIEITVKNQVSGTINYSLSPSSNQKESFDSQDTIVRRLVTRGEYEIVAQQENSSAVTSVKTSGFLQTTQVELELSKENQRTFVGDTPKQCISASPTLVSWKCRGRVSTAVKYVPATSSIPGYAAPITSSTEPIIIEGMIEWGSSRWALSKTSSAEGISHILYPLDTNNNFSFVGNIVLGDLSENRDYSITTYEQGWLVYSTDGDDLLYYTNFNSSPERLTPAKPSIEGLELYSVNAFGDALAMVFNENSTPETHGSSFVTNSAVNTEETIEEFDEGEKVERLDQVRKTEVVIFRQGETLRFTLDFTAKQVRYCGANLICTLNLQDLEVYEVSGSELNKIYTYYDVSQIENASDRLLVIDDTGVLSLDPLENTGHYVYSFGEYQFCGITTQSILGVCIEGAGKKSLLSISNSELLFSIDQAVLELENKTEVTAVSVYGNLVYVSPDFGEFERNIRTNRLEYNPERKASANSAISQYIQELQLESNGYIVRQTLN